VFHTNKQQEAGTPQHSAPNHKYNRMVSSGWNGIKTTASKERRLAPDNLPYGQLTIQSGHKGMDSGTCVNNHVSITMPN